MGDGKQKNHNPNSNEGINSTHQAVAVGKKHLPLAVGIHSGILFEFLSQGQL